MTTKKEQIIETSKVIYGDILYEQIYDPKQKTSHYLGWDEKEQELITEEFIEHTPRKYLPINDDLLLKGAVLLPSEAIDYTDIKTLDQEISDFIYTYSDISKGHQQKATWYIRLSWVIDKINTIPYLRALGDYGTGKTRYLDVIGGICYKPMFVGGAVRSAPIFRTIDTWRGTAIFDEFTLSKSDETEDIIQILNNGYERGKPVLRCRDGDNKVIAFDPFGAKIISSRKTFFDVALESRCITEITKETDRTDIPISLSNAFFKKRQELRNKLLKYRFDNWDKINIDENQKIDFGHIQPRIKQSFLPFTILFQYDKEVLEDFIKEVKQYNDELVYDSSSSMDGQIVNCFLKMKANYDPIITAKDIRNDMVNDGWKDTLKASTVGRHLKTLGFVSGSKTIDGRTFRILTINDARIKHLIYRYVIEERQQDFLEVVKQTQKKLEGET